MLWRSHQFLLILAFQSTHRVPSTLAFCRASSDNLQYKSVRRIAAITGRKMCSSEETQQLFGRFKISPNQIFHRTAHSFALVNLRPLVPGHVLICSNRVTPLLSDLEEDEYNDLWRTVRVVQNWCGELKNLEL